MPELPTVISGEVPVAVAETAMDLPERVFWSFRADDRLYGIEVNALREVSTNTAISPVPHAPAAIRGLTNLRSRILMVLDLRPLLGLPVVALTTESRLVILKPTVIEDVGILVDRGGDIVRVRPDQVESAEQSAHLLSRDSLALVTGVCKLEHELMMIVDAKRIAARMAAAMG